MSLVLGAVARLTEAADGQAGKLLFPTEEPGELAEYVFVRRSDLELLLATWTEKKA